jgi:glutamyl-tRNA synthetase
LRWHLQREDVRAEDDTQLGQIVLALRERSKTLKEMAANSLFFFKAPLVYDEKAVRKHVTPDILNVLTELSTAMVKLEIWSAPAIHALIGALAAEKGVSLGKLAQPVRLAVCGRTVSPPIDATLEILGREESLARLDKAMAIWSA